jgi:branched-chain amino acid transport system ATP-binding protein
VRERASASVSYLRWREAGPRTNGIDVTVLQLRGLHAGYQGVPVVRGLDLDVAAGEVLALLGPNGAGKTTTLSTISGFLPVISGTVEIMGEPTDSRRPFRVAQRGVAHVVEDRSLFFGLTVLENLQVVAGLRRRARQEAYDRAFDLFPALRPLLARKAGLLSGGEQQMLAMARAIITNPQLLIVDEMSLGLAPVIVEQMLPVVRAVAEEGAAVLIVEQHIHLALELADRAVVMTNGRTVAEGSAAELRNDLARIRASYFD